MTSTRNHSARSRWFLLGRRVFRRAAAATLALALLTPVLAALTIQRAASCGMSCCRSGQCARCHRTGIDEHPQGARWTAATLCPKGCGQYTATPTAPGLSAARGVRVRAVGGCRYCDLRRRDRCRRAGSSRSARYSPSSPRTRLWPKTLTTTRDAPPSCGLATTSAITAGTISLGTG